MKQWNVKHFSGVGTAVFANRKYFGSGYPNPSPRYWIRKMYSWHSIFTPKWKQQLSQKSPCLRLILLWNITQLPQRKRNWFERSPSKAINKGRPMNSLKERTWNWVLFTSLKTGLLSIIHHYPVKSTVFHLAHPLLYYSTGFLLKAKGWKIIIW